MNEFARRYEALVSGDPFATDDGLRCRIIPGTKQPIIPVTTTGPGDLVLQIESGGQWRWVKFASLGLIVEFMYRNEDFLYAPPRYQGGEKFMRHLRDAINFGHKQADRKLEWEKQNKGVQLGLFDRDTA